MSVMNIISYFYFNFCRNCSITRKVLFHYNSKVDINFFLFLSDPWSGQIPVAKLDIAEQTYTYLSTELCCAIPAYSWNTQLCDLTGGGIFSLPVKRNVVQFEFINPRTLSSVCTGYSRGGGGSCWLLLRSLGLHKARAGGVLAGGH